MAAVMALIMVPLCLVLGVFVVHADLTITGAFAMASFVALAVGMLVGLTRFIQRMEPPETHI
jgi:hypothetical protein